jgi:autotransporter-associated beta strand protein
MQFLEESVKHLTVNGAPIVFNNLTFNSTGYTLANGTGSLSLANDLASTITVATGTATIGESIVNNADGASALTKDGAGMLVLSGDNTFTGALTVAGGGTLILTGNNAARPASTRDSTVVYGTLQLQANTANTVGGVSTALSGERTTNDPTNNPFSSGRAAPPATQRQRSHFRWWQFLSNVFHDGYHRRKSDQRCRH